MGVRVLHDDEDRVAVLYDTEADAVFGPVFHPIEGRGATGAIVAEEFLAWLDRETTSDASSLEWPELMMRAIDFCYMRERPA